MLTQLQAQPKLTTRESGLPECVQKRLAQLRAMVDDHESVRSNLQRRLGELLPDERYEKAEIDKRMRANNTALGYVRELLGRVDEALQKGGVFAHLAPTQLVEVPRLGVPLKGTDWGRVENIRTEVTRIKKEMGEVKRTPLPFSQIEAQLKSLVNTWASQGSPSVTVDPVRGHVDASWGFHPPKPHKIMAWLDTPKMLERLVSQARKQSDAKGGASMTAEVKEDTLKALTKRLQEIELEEVAIIDTLQAQGVTEAQHRVDVSPWALLGVKEPRGLLKSTLGEM